MRIEDNTLIIEKKRSESITLMVNLDSEQLDLSDFPKILCDVKEVKDVDSPSLYSPVPYIADGKLVMIIPSRVMERLPPKTYFDIKIVGPTTVLVLLEGEIEISNNVTKVF